jgi:hypothetical protein
MPGTDVRDTRSTTMCPACVTSTPHCSRLSPAVFGTVPTVIKACEPSTVRPSVSSTSTPFSVRRTLAARPRSAIRPPRDWKTCSTTAAASASSPGNTWSREETSVTGTPASR